MAARALDASLDPKLLLTFLQENQVRCARPDFVTIAAEHAAIWTLTLAEGEADARRASSASTLRDAAAGNGASPRHLLSHEMAAFTHARHHHSLRYPTALLASLCHDVFFASPSLRRPLHPRLGIDVGAECLHSFGHAVFYLVARRHADLAGYRACRPLRPGAWHMEDETLEAAIDVCLNAAPPAENASAAVAEYIRVVCTLPVPARHYPRTRDTIWRRMARASARERPSSERPFAGV